MNYILTGAHRALPDVIAMERVVTHQSTGQLSLQSFNLFFRAANEFYQKRVFGILEVLIRSLEKPAVTRPQAKQLDELGLAHQDLARLHSQSKDKKTFSRS